MAIPIPTVKCRSPGQLAVFEACKGLVDDITKRLLAGDDVDRLYEQRNWCIHEFKNPFDGDMDRDFPYYVFLRNLERAEEY